MSRRDPNTERLKNFYEEVGFKLVTDEDVQYAKMNRMNELASHLCRHYPEHAMAMRDIKTEEGFCMRMYNDSRKVMEETIEVFNAAFKPDEMELTTNIHNGQNSRPAIGIKVNQKAANNDKVEDFVTSIRYMTELNCLTEKLAITSRNPV